MNPIEQRIETFLKKAHKEHLFRSLGKTVPEGTINCAGNSYLNLQADTKLHAKALNLSSNTSGNGASRLVQEVSPLFDSLEEQLASWHSTERALLFNSGYVANLSIIQALATKKSTIFCDKLNHASIIDGVRLSGAQLLRYNHCDTDHLSKLLSQSDAEEKIVITDTVFSMDGTVAPLKEIAHLCEEYNALLMVDEAHATGVFGPTGAGLTEELGLESLVHLQMGTLSKAVCGIGGFVACSQQLYDYFVNTCRGLIYSTALPPITLAWNSVAIDAIRSNPTMGKNLLKRALAFKSELEAAGIETGETQSQIVPIITETEERALDLARHLRARGYIAPAIRPPTVPKGTCRVRISLHAGLTTEDIKKLTHHILGWFRG